MKNKGMHQQPNAYTPSTGGSAPQGKSTANKGSFTGPGGQHSHQPQTNWQTPTAPSTGNGGFNKPGGGKKAA